MSRRIVVIGGGIVGTAVAAYLSEHNDLDVTVLERGPGNRLLGSTGHAPGFVGLFNESLVATELARTSAACYEQLSWGGLSGFDRVGGLEIASTAVALTELQRRAGLAQAAGLPARILAAEEAAAYAPQLIDPDQCVGGVLYPQDGTARAGVITAALKERAIIAGARFVYDAPVAAIDVGGDKVHAVSAAGEIFRADDVVIAAGIWGPVVADLVGEQLPVTAVAHPYLYGPPHGRSASSSPFVRWPEHHVYARDHGDRFGLGTYDHQPLQVTASEFGDHAEMPWHAEVFEPAVTRAMDLLPPGQRFTPEHRLNGVFSMTADNLPLLGPLKTMSGLWIAEAIWVTHAAGAAQALSQLMTGTTPSPGYDALQPDRFAGQPANQLTDRALRLYRDIYATA